MFVIGSGVELFLRYMNIDKFVSTKYMAATLTVIVAATALNLSHTEISVGNFLAFHSLAELSSILVCFLVFATAYYGFQQSRNTSDLVLGLALVITGLLDLVHTLSYNGMPNFLAVNTTGLAAAYWIAARLAFGIGLCIACIVKPNRRKVLLTPQWAIALAIALVTGIVAVFTANGEFISELMFNDQTNMLTSVKISLEAIVIVTYALGIVLLHRKRDWDNRTIVMLRTALIIAIAAELYFCSYHSPYAWYNATGHVLKSISYLCILNALFVSALQKPYMELSRARYRLRDLYREAKKSRNEIETSFTKIGLALSASVQVSEASSMVAQLARDICRSDCAVIRVGDYTDIQSERICSGTSGTCPSLTKLAEEYNRRARADHEARTRTFAENEIEANCEYGGSYPIRHMLSTCLAHEGRFLGTLSLFRRSAEEYSQREINLVTSFAYHAAVAITNAINYEKEQRIASILQESITQVSPTTVDRVDIGHFYKPVMEEASIGGDLLDVMMLADNKIGLVIGDVSGKGLRAAVHTALVKYALRAYLSEGHSPEQATSRLETLVTDFLEEDRFITLFVAVLDTETGELVYTNAGHEPPIICKSSICGNLDSTGPALGISISGDFSENRIMMEPKDVLVMFTDGLTERGGGMPDFGVDKVADILINHDGLNCSRLVNNIYQTSRSSESGELRDDVAVLAVRLL